MTLIVEASQFGYLDGWVDFDASGNWNEPQERVFDPSEPLDTGFGWVSFAVPKEAVPTSTYARFRFSSSGSLPYVGGALDGEVEDYAVQICSRFMTWIMTDALHYRVGDRVAISYYVSEPARVSLVSYKPDKSHRVLWEGIVEAGRHWFPGPGERLTAQPVLGTETVAVRATSLETGCTALVSTPFRVTR